MNIRNLIRSLVPPLLVDQYRKMFPRPTWQGIYSRFADIKTDDEGLSGEIWANIVEKETRAEAEKLSKEEAFSLHLRGDNALLPFLVSAFVHARSGARILDFGGGAGIDYLHVRRALSKEDRIEFHIVESARICEWGRAFHGNDSQIIFHDSLPKQISSFDIVHMDSVLQYIEDYPLLLGRLCAYEPEYFLFIRLSAGDIPTYVTKQVNVPGVSTCYQFINIRELVSVMNGFGYTLAFKNAGDRSYDQSNFPSEYRMTHTCNLLFTRERNMAVDNPGK